MKRLIILLALLSTHAFGAMFGVDEQDIRTTPLVVNGGFENSKSKWNTNGGSFGIATSGINVGLGDASAAWDASAAAQDLTSDQYTVPNSLKGAPCVASWMWKDGDSNLTVQIIDGTATVLASYPLVTAASWTRDQLTFSCPQSSTIAFRVLSGADAAQVVLDDIFVGKVPSQTVAVNPIVYTSTRSIGTVGAVANDKGPLVDGDITFASSAYFPLAGDALNDASSGGDLTASGSPSYSGKGFFGRENSLIFDGTDDYLTSSSSFFEPTGDMTTGGWFTFDEVSGDPQYLINMWGPSKAYVIFLNTNGTVYGQFSSDGTSDVSVFTSIDPGTHHIAVVHDDTANEVRLYVDGQLADTTAFAGPLFASTQDFTIGKRSSDATRYFKGVAQDIFFETDALTSAEINAIYSKRFSNDEQIAGGHVLTADSFPYADLTDKVSYWNLGDVNDDSGNGKNLTNEGGIVFTGSDIFGQSGVASLDGADDTFSSADAFFNRGDQDFTTGGWVKADDWQANVDFIVANYASASDRGFQVYINGTANNIVCSASTDGTGTAANVLLDTSGIVDGTWHFVVFKYESATNTMTCSIDDITGSADLGAGLFQPSVNIFRLGARYSIASGHLKAHLQDWFFTTSALSDEDIRKLASSRLDLASTSVPVADQDWSASLWGREDGKLDNQLSPDWLLDKTADSVYLDTGLPSGSEIGLKLRNTGFSGFSVGVKQYDSGLLSSAPSFPLNHLLPGRPSEVVVWTEGQTEAGEWDQRRDLCSVTDTQLNCDLSSLTIDGTHRVQLMASMVPGGAFVTNDGSVEADTITDFAGTGAPNFPFGATGISASINDDFDAVNLIVNRGFEAGTNNWTNTGSGTFSATSTAANVGYESNAGQWDAGAASDKLASDAYSVPNILTNRQCHAEFAWKGGDDDITARVVNGSSEVLVSQILRAEATYTTIPQMLFPCPAFGDTVALEFVAGADAAVIYIDHVFVGTASVSSSYAKNGDLISAYKVSDQTIGESGTTMTFDIEVVDQTDAYDGTNTYTVKTAGKYLVTFTTGLVKSSGTSIASDSFQIHFRVNGTNFGPIPQVSAGHTVGAYQMVNESAILDLDVGDTVYVQMAPNFGGGRTFVGATRRNVLSISRQDAGNVTLINDSVAYANARAGADKGGVNQNIGDAAITKVQFDTVLYDTTGAWSTANDEYTVPADGEYEISATLAYTVNVTDPQVLVYIDSAAEAKVRKIGVFTSQHSMSIDVTRKLTKGQVIDIRAYHATGSTKAMAGNTDLTYMSIKRLSDYTAGSTSGQPFASATTGGLISSEIRHTSNPSGTITGGTISATTLKMHKSGDSILATMQFTIGGSPSASTVSFSGAAPSEFRPSAGTIKNVYGVTGSEVVSMQVNSSGDISVIRRDWSGSGLNWTASGGYISTMSYIIP